MKVAVGLSGGVDSAVAAALLTHMGYEVVGVCMKIWDGSQVVTSARHACYGPEETRDIEDARKVASVLKIPFYLIDLTVEYKRYVLEYVRREYRTGRTPNPCIRCNQRIKFGALIEKTRSRGIRFDRFATGHYARVEYDVTRERYLLKKARDVRKDQSYWLAFLTQRQLGLALFPLGDFTKHEVRSIARSYQLPIYEKSDSQDFFSGDYTELMQVPAKPGQIIDREGRVLGTHQGIWHYTIGQRRGLGIAHGKPLYVLDLDEKSNVVLVGTREELAREELIANQVNLISIDKLREPMNVTLKMRYAQKEFEGTLLPLRDGRVQVTFARPQSAVTPGQAAVFYEGDVVIGGGIIARRSASQMLESTSDFGLVELGSSPGSFQAQ